VLELTTLSKLNYLCLGPILKYDFVTTGVLQMISKTMKCLKGLRIQQCFNLDEVVDISPVTQITTLEALKLHGVRRTWTRGVDWSPLKRLQKLHLGMSWWESNDFCHRGFGILPRMKQLCLWDSKSYDITEVSRLSELTVLFLCHPAEENDADAPCETVTKTQNLYFLRRSRPTRRYHRVRMSAISSGLDLASA